MQKKRMAKAKDKPMKEGSCDVVKLPRLVRNPARKSTLVKSLQVKNISFRPDDQNLDVDFYTLANNCSSSLER